MKIYVNPEIPSSYAYYDLNGNYIDLYNRDTLNNNSSYTVYRLFPMLGNPDFYEVNTVNTNNNNTIDPRPFERGSILSRPDNINIFFIIFLFVYFMVFISYHVFGFMTTSLKGGR